MQNARKKKSKHPQACSRNNYRDLNLMISPSDEIENNIDVLIGDMNTANMKARKRDRDWDKKPMNSGVRNKPAFNWNTPKNGGNGNSNNQMWLLSDGDGCNTGAIVENNNSPINFDNFNDIANDMPSTSRQAINASNFNTNDPNFWTNVFFPLNTTKKPYKLMSVMPSTSSGTGTSNGSYHKNLNSNEQPSLAQNELNLDSLEPFRSSSTSTSELNDDFYALSIDHLYNTATNANSNSINGPSSTSSSPASVSASTSKIRNSLSRQKAIDCLNNSRMKNRQEQVENNFNIANSRFLQVCYFVIVLFIYVSD